MKIEPPRPAFDPTQRKMLDRIITDGAHGNRLVDRAVHHREIEGLIGYARRNFLVPIPRLESFAALDSWLESQCLRRQSDRLRGHDETIGERLARCEYMDRRANTIALGPQVSVRPVLPSGWDSPPVRRAIGFASPPPPVW